MDYRQRLAAYPPRETLLDALVEPTDALDRGKEARLRYIMEMYTNANEEEVGEIITRLRYAYTSVLANDHTHRGTQYITSASMLKEGKDVMDFLKAIVLALWPDERTELSRNTVKFDYTITIRGQRMKHSCTLNKNKWGEIGFYTRPHGSEPHFSENDGELSSMYSIIESLHARIGELERAILK